MKQTHTEEIKMIISNDLCIMKGGAYANTRNFDYLETVRVEDTLIVSKSIMIKMSKIKDNHRAIKKIIERLNFIK